MKLKSVNKEYKNWRKIKVNKKVVLSSVSFVASSIMNQKTLAGSAELTGVHMVESCGGAVGNAVKMLMDVN